VEVLIVVLFSCGNHGWCRDSWFGYFLCENCPVIGIFIEIWQTVFWNTVSNTNVNSCWWKNSMYLIEHWFRIRTWIITAKSSIEAGLINNCIKTSIFELELSGIHLLELQIWYFLLVIFLHLFYHSKWNVNVCDMLETILKHFFTHLWVSATKVKNLEWWLNILGDYIFNSTISLIPVEWFFVFLISVFPIFLLSVLSHFSKLWIN